MRPDGLVRSRWMAAQMTPLSRCDPNIRQDLPAPTSPPADAREWPIRIRLDRSRCGGRSAHDGTSRPDLIGRPSPTAHPAECICPSLPARLLALRTAGLKALRLRSRHTIAVLACTRAIVNSGSLLLSFL